MYRLFLDISSTCTGYCISKVVDDIVIIVDFGAIWFPKEVTTEFKCKFLFDKVISYYDKYKLEHMVYEKYSFNTKMVMGSLVLPHLIGAVMVASETVGTDLSCITPQTWRKQCGIKPIKIKNKRNYKIPTEDYFRQQYKIPEKIESNITGNLRTVPSDVFDALGICEGFYRSVGLNKFERGK